VAPSLICNRLFACSALRDACVIERMSARSLLAIPRPAASSAARLILKPDDNFAIESATRPSVIPSWRCALSAATLVLIRMVLFLH
jgi:hypothetical protein